MSWLNKLNLIVLKYPFFINIFNKGFPTISYRIYSAMRSGVGDTKYPNENSINYY